MLGGAPVCWSLSAGTFLALCPAHSVPLIVLNPLVEASDVSPNSLRLVVLLCIQAELRDSLFKSFIFSYVYVYDLFVGLYK